VNGGRSGFRSLDRALIVDVKVLDASVEQSQVEFTIADQIED
jgi:hypothetical protein